MLKFVLQFYGWYVRVGAYLLLLNDVYPPFAMEA